MDRRCRGKGEWARAGALAALAENLDHPNDHASTFQIKRDMEASGFTKAATTLALRSLLQKGLLEIGQHEDPGGDYYTGYKLTDQGWSWILGNKDKFILRKQAHDDIPF